MWVKKEPPYLNGPFQLTFEEVDCQIVTGTEVCLAVDGKEQVDLPLGLELG